MKCSPFHAYMLNSIGKKYAVHDNIHFGKLLGNFWELLNKKLWKMLLMFFPFKKCVNI